MRLSKLRKIGSMIQASKLRRTLCLLGVGMIGVFLTSCDNNDDKYTLKASNQVVDRGFDTPKSNDVGAAVYFRSINETGSTNEKLQLIIKQPNNSITTDLDLEEDTGSRSEPTVIQNVIITPTGRAAAFWNRSNDSTKLYYAFTNTALNEIDINTRGSFTLPTNGTAGATGLSGISLATNSNNQVVVAWDLGADPMSTNPVSQFAVFDANGTLTKGQTNLFSYGPGEFSLSDMMTYLPKVAIDGSGNILFGQSGSFETLFKYFSGSTLNPKAANNGYYSSYRLLTCKSTSQGLFAILTDTPPTVSSTLQTSGTLQLVYYQLSGDQINVAGSSGVSGNPLTTDLVQFWDASNKADTSKSFFITGLSGDASGVTANGLTFSDPNLLTAVSPIQKINNDTANINLVGFNGGTVNYAGINNGRFIAAVTGSLWGGLGNFATGQVSFVRKLSDQVPLDAQVSIGPNGEYVFFWTDASGRVETYPSSGSSPTIRGALQKFSPVKVQKGLARP